MLAFTAWPFAQMIWMSLHNWSLIAARKFIGTANFVRAWNDPQFWVSLGFTFKYTLYITPILMGLGFLIALLVAEDTPHRARSPAPSSSRPSSSASAPRACSGTGSSATTTAS